MAGASPGTPRWGASAGGPSETCKDLTAHIYSLNLTKSIVNLVDFFFSSCVAHFRFSRFGAVNADANVPSH